MNEKQKRIETLFPELQTMENGELADKARDMWVYFWEKSTWDDVVQAPFNFEGLNLTLVQHTQSVLHGALALADVLRTTQNINVNRDLLIAACILHDVSKLVEYSGTDENGKAQKTTEGKLYQHAFLGAAKALEWGLPQELISIILLHTPQSLRENDSVECLLLKMADHASAEAPKLTVRK